MKRLIPSPDESIHDIEVMIDVHTSLGRSGGSEEGSCEGKRLVVRTSNSPKGSREAPPVVGETSNETPKIRILQNGERQITYHLH